MNWNAALYNTHRQHVVDGNLLNTNVTPPSEKHAWRRSSMHTLEARWTRKIVAALLLTTIISLRQSAPPPSPQAHGMINVWQWRAFGNDHGNTQKQKLLATGLHYDARRSFRGRASGTMSEGNAGWLCVAIKKRLKHRPARGFLIYIKNKVKQCVKLKKKKHRLIILISAGWLPTKLNVSKYSTRKSLPLVTKRQTL